MARSSPLSTSRWAAASSLAVAVILAAWLAAWLAACAHAPAAPTVCGARIARTWHGRVPSARADEYERYITDAITKFRTLPGNRGYDLMRETVGEETHFSVTSYWDSRDAIHAYAGADIAKVHPLPRDPEFLIDAEPTVSNYDLIVQNVDCPK